ncbi:hypothetical protein AMECASPLE_030750 [Ameca splendens]|uniref:Uncharacterized protein n=1 Tax=Ameca splendens TaxID=208324 RepID=A0ABV0ZRC6_9TELE
MKTVGQSNSPTSGGGGRRAGFLTKHCEEPPSRQKLVGHVAADRRSSAEEQCLPCRRSLKVMPWEMIGRGGVGWMVAQLVALLPCSKKVLG